MKKLILLLAITAFTTSSNYAQTKTTGLLQAYYGMKDALVAGDASLTSAKATEFIAALESPDVKALPDASRKLLTKEAAFITQSKDLKMQREHFAGFSTEMIAAAKALKLSADPVYIQYCPMKKNSWLSNDKAIKNPYYGKMMLTCGSVTGTL